MGTSHGQGKPTETKKDHPHACGDKASASAGVFSLRGSSPRVWGQAVSVLEFSPQAGIIPTRVGTSSSHQNLQGNGWDHPHACGDKYAVSYTAYGKMGSSPRVWGQVVNKEQRQSDQGIIPTRVGTRSPSGKVRRWS